MGGEGGGGGWSFMDRLFSRGGVLFEACKLQTWPEQLCFMKEKK